VAIEFLPDAQAAGYAVFPEVLSQAELERYFFLDDADLEAVAPKRRAHNRLGFAVQLASVRYLGRFMPDPRQVRVEVAEYLAEQLEIADPSCLKEYGERDGDGPYPRRGDSEGRHPADRSGHCDPGPQPAGEGGNPATDHGGPQESSTLHDNSPQEDPSAANPRRTAARHPTSDTAGVRKRAAETVCRWTARSSPGTAPVSLRAEVAFRPRSDVRAVSASIPFFARQCWVLRGENRWRSSILKAGPAARYAEQGCCCPRRQRWWPGSR
jgi:hypothetical protein